MQKDRKDVTFVIFSLNGMVRGVHVAERPCGLDQEHQNTKNYIVKIKQ